MKISHAMYAKKKEKNDKTEGKQRESIAAPWFHACNESCRWKRNDDISDFKHANVRNHFLDIIWLRLIYRSFSCDSN